MKKGQRPKQHYRRIKTKRGRKRILINKGIKRKERKVKRRRIGKPAGRFVGFHKFKSQKIMKPKFKEPFRQPRIGQFKFDEGKIRKKKSENEFEMTLGDIISAQEMQERANIQSLVNQADQAVEHALKIQDALIRADIEKTREIELAKATARKQAEINSFQNKQARLASKKLKDIQKTLAKISVKPENEDPEELFGKYNLKKKMDVLKDMIVKSGSRGIEKGLDKQFEEIQKIANLEFTQRAVRKGKASEVDLAQALFDRGEITNKQLQEVRFREGVMSPQEVKEWKAGLKMINAPEVKKGTTILVSTGPEGLGPRIEIDANRKESKEKEPIKDVRRMTISEIVDQFGKEKARQLILSASKEAKKEALKETRLSKADLKRLRENIEMSKAFEKDISKIPTFHPVGKVASKIKPIQGTSEKEWTKLEKSLKKQEMKNER